MTASFAAENSGGSVQMGVVSAQGITHASHWLKSLPPEINRASRDLVGATALVLGCLLSQSQDARERQLSLLAQHNAAIAKELSRLLPSLISVPIKDRLKLIELSLNQLRSLSIKQREWLIETARQLIGADGQVDLTEYVFLSLLHIALLRSKRGGFTRMSSEAAVATVLSALAVSVSSDPSRQSQAFAAGVARLPNGALQTSVPVQWNWESLDGALHQLGTLAPSRKKTVIDACSHVVKRDDQINEQELMLMLAVCAALEVPVPIDMDHPLPMPAA